MGDLLFLYFGTFRKGASIKRLFVVKNLNCAIKYLYEGEKCQQPAFSHFSTSIHSLNLSSLKNSVETTSYYTFVLHMVNTSFIWQYIFYLYGIKIVQILSSRRWNLSEKIMVCTRAICVKLSFQRTVLPSVGGNLGSKNN